ncbi:hypothetical protein JW796_00775 [Candidatus Dojkabacteria bacterium]|nr:hypothetical protein [Candidatus Dojkabacteria bacterium]
MGIDNRIQSTKPLASINEGGMSSHGSLDNPSHCRIHNTPSVTRDRINIGRTNEKYFSINRGYQDLPKSIWISNSRKLTKYECTSGVADNLPRQKDCCRIVAANYLEAGLSFPEDDEIMVIGNDEMYMRDNIDSDEENFRSTYTLVSNGEDIPLISARLVTLTDKGKQQNEELPIHTRLKTAIIGNEIDLKQEEIDNILSLEHEITRLGFNTTIIREAQVSPTLVVAAWIRTIYAIMDKRNINRIGAIISDMTYSLFSKLGIDFITLGQEIKYKETDRFHSRFVIIDIENISEKLLSSKEPRHIEILNFLLNGNSENNRFRKYIPIDHSD